MSQWCGRIHLVHFKLMKLISLLLASLMLSVGVRAQSLELPVLESAVFNALDLDSDDTAELIYQVDVWPAGPEESFFDVLYTIQPQANAQLLRPSVAVISFEHAQLISVGNPIYQTHDGYKELSLNFFQELLNFPFWNYADRTFPLPQSLLLGFRADLEDGRHYGWLSFSRPNTEFTTPFTLDAWDWHPLPDAPIRAGLPPEIPLNSELTEDETGQPVLRLSWPTEVFTWLLESTTDLTPPIQWEYYPTGGAWVDVPLGAEEEPVRYFRLRQP